MKKRSKKIKYSTGSLLLLLAFVFYMACNPDKKGSRKERKPAAEQVYNDEDSLVMFTGKVVSIKDGDTFEVIRNGKAEKIRLTDIDAPESSQPFGKAAKKFASDLCYGKEVIVKPKKRRDKYGRILGTIYIQDSLNINEEMVKAGYAWRYKYSKKKLLLTLQNEAKHKRRGLWIEDDAIDPWQWRKQNSR